MNATPKGFDLIAVVVIAIVSLAIAVVTFGWLDSSGTSETGGGQLTGAVVGFVVSFAALMGSYRALLKSTYRDLEAKVEELSRQLIRGAPRPEGYSVELLEHHRLVLARPTSYESRGGVILDIQEPDRKPGANGDLVVDPVPSRLWVTFTPLQRERSPEAYYRRYIADTKDNPRYEVMAVERTIIGSDAATSDALRVTTRRCARVVIRCDPSGRLDRTRSSIPIGDWASIEAGPTDLHLDTNDLKKPGFELETVVRVRQSMVVCLHPGLEQIFFFAFEDDEDHFVENVEALNQCLRSVRFLV